MKTEYLLLLVLSLFYHTGLKAEEIRVTLFNTCTENRDKWVKDSRSITIVPTATIDKNTLRIYSDIPINDVSIILKDKSDNVIYSNTSMIASRCHTFEIYDLSEGNYTLEIEFGETSYYGYFSY